ncbi:aldo/keto reductase [Listeria kieliensis]
MEYKTLNNGLKVPVLGFGVFQITDQDEAEQAVLHALQTGYRLIDTAAVYLNEEAVGRAIQKSGISRSEITLTTKLWITDASYDGAMRAFERSTKKLGTDYLDIFLIHQPYSDYYGAWRALTELYRAGKVKAIGVSNFSTGRLTDLILNQEVKPVLDQIELHPYRGQARQRDTAAHFDVAIEAWSPFNQGKDGIFEDPVLMAIARKHGKTVPQVILRWQIQLGNMAIPKSTHANRIEENFAIFDFKLTEEEIQQIASLDRAPDSTGPRENYQLVERLNGITLD